MSPRVKIFCQSFLLFMFCFCHAVLSVHCSYLLALLFVMFFMCFVTFPFGVLGQAWYLIVSIPDVCLLPYFAEC